jgi:hypothetical protein
MYTIGAVALLITIIDSGPLKKTLLNSFRSAKNASGK